jgi:hypothetical protein
VAGASKRSVLSVLTKGRLEDLGREFGVPLQSTATKDAQVAVLADSALDLPSVLGRLRRDELRSACRAHGVDATGRGRPRDPRPPPPPRRPRPGSFRRLRLALHPRPAYETATTPATRAAQEFFEDEIIDRLFALNATRAEQETLKGSTPSATCVGIQVLSSQAQTARRPLRAGEG